jgi:branched-chain amino acid transport system ATP-binding protein
MIEVKEITVRYGGITALDRISLLIPDGKMISIVGANGAGKSTTINAISGMVPLSGGGILFDGQSLAIAPHLVARQGVVQVPEGRKIFSSITVRENLLLGAYMIRDRKRIEENLKKVYLTFPILEKRQGQPGGTLSGGEQQMLAIGRALMAKPKLLLVDELSWGLMPKMVDLCFEALASLKARGITILLVEQNSNRALEFVENVCVIASGAPVYNGSAAGVLNDAAIFEKYLGVGD